MGFDESDGYENGLYADASVIYGPTVGARSRAADTRDNQDTLSATPLEGAIGETGISASKRPTVKGFVASPVGWLLILLVVGYVVFDHVFGEAA